MSIHDIISIIYKQVIIVSIIISNLNIYAKGILRNLRNAKGETLTFGTYLTQIHLRELLVFSPWLAFRCVEQHRVPPSQPPK